MVPRHTRRSPRPATLLAALLVALLGAIGGASPASADVVRSGCATGPGGLFDGAHHPGACWRPFSAASPFNQRLPTNDSRTEPNSSAIVDRLNAFGAPNPLEFGPGEDGQGRGAKAIYFSEPSDPLYEVQLLNATGRGGPWGANPLDGMQIRIPEGARPGKYSDRHFIVVDQQQNVSYDLWQVRQDVLSGGGTITATWGGKISLASDGRTRAGDGGSNAAGLGLLGGLLRPEELAQGDIPHALYMSVQCTNGTSVFPSTRPADDGEKDCASSGGGDNANAPALGQRFQLGYSDQQIAAMNVPPHEKVLLRAMAHYGLFVIDTTPEAWHLDQESSIDRPALGLPDPGVSFAQKAGLDFYADRNRYALSLASIPGRDGRAGSWTRDLHALQPCVTSGGCASPKVAKKPATLWPVGRAVKSRTTVTATVSVRTSATVSSPAPASASATATATATAHIRRPSWLARARGKRKARGEKAAVDRASGRAHAQARADARKLAMSRAQSIAYTQASEGVSAGR